MSSDDLSQLVPTQFQINILPSGCHLTNQCKAPDLYELVPLARAASIKYSAKHERREMTDGWRLETRTCGCRVTTRRAKNKRTRTFLIFDMLICYKEGGPDPGTFPLSKQLFKPTDKNSAMIPHLATRLFGLRNLLLHLTVVVVRR